MEHEFDELNNPKSRAIPYEQYFGEMELTEEQKELFSRYTDAVREYQTMAECLLFQNSFKLGAKMMLEVMSE